MQYIELQQIPSQEFHIVLAEQNCKIKVYQKDNKTFTNLYIDDVEIWTGMLTHSFTNCKPFNYLKFKGALVFIDLYGMEDPDFNEYNTRFQLIYMSDEEFTNIYS